MAYAGAMHLLPLARRPRVPAPSGAPPHRAASRPAARAEDAATTALDPRQATFRQMNDFSFELYLEGELAFPESAYLGRPVERQPAYARTVGRLSLIDVDFDAPRDHVRLWEDRLAFALRYMPEDRDRVERLKRIVGALRRHSLRLDAAKPTRRWPLG
jgi:hypothetical protein